jgi:cytoskeletal protein CcmA (bactofilin family)
MFTNKEKPSKTKTMERNVVAKNTSITGDITSEGNFRIDGTLEGTLKTNGRVIIGVEGMIKGKVESGNATCAMKGAVKELNQHEQQRLLSEKTA